MKNNKRYFISFDSHDHHRAAQDMEDWVNDDKNVNEVEILQMATAATNCIYIITVMYKIRSNHEYGLNRNR